MNIIVCMKAVPSTDQIQVDGQFRLQRDSAKLQWNIADESALEAALQLKAPEDSVTVITMGPNKLTEPMRELLARGADSAVLIADPVFGGSDTIATANTLSAAVKKLGDFSLILCGRRAIDGETGQVPGMLSAALSIPCITNAESLWRENETVLITRRMEGGTAMLEAQFPLCVSICEYTYTLRLPGILGMRRAKEKNVDLLSATDLALPPEQCGLRGSLTRVVQMDTRFPGLRKGVTETNISLGAKSILTALREVDL